MKQFHFFSSVVLLILSLAGCTDNVMEPVFPAEDMSQYWYSRTRSPQEEKVMNRHHAVGFSYNAVSGSKCNAGDVRCMVLNMDNLKEWGLYYEVPQTEAVDSCEVRRGVNDCLQVTSWSTDIASDLGIYEEDHTKDVLLRENINDSTLIFRQTIGLNTGYKGIDLDFLLDNPNGLVGELTQHPEVFLSDNFQYALMKLKKAGDNVAVVDSFINIFGTHVVSRISYGGTFQLTLRTSKRNVTSYLQEQEFKKSVSKLFVKTEKIEETEHHEVFKNIFKSAVMELRVKGGDTSLFADLAANPTYESSQASMTSYYKWLDTILENDGDEWSERSELIDMEVTPIWEFIPDKKIALAVKSRIVASAQAMRDLYGELNFSNAAIRVNDDYYLNPDIQPLNLSNPELFTSICHTLTDGNGRPSKLVAATYREYIPELAEKGLDAMATVTYPIYENRLQMDEGVAKCSDGKWRNVKWLYDRFIVEDIAPDSGETISLYRGKLYTENPQKTDVSFAPTKRMPDYAWPGSLDTSGTPTTGTIVYPVRKFLNQFFLFQDTAYYSDLKEVTNLPGWSYYGDSEELIPSHYMAGWFKTASKEEAFEKSGIKNGTTRRMIRNSNFRYTIIPSELK